MSVDAAIWSRAALAEQVLRRRRDGRAEVVLRVPALGEPHRALRLERTLQALPGVARMSFDIAARRATLAVDDERLSLPQLLAACADAGCPAEPLHRDRLDAGGREALDASLKRLIVAGLFGMQAMMFSLVLYLGGSDPVDRTTMRLFEWLAMLSAVPVVGYAAWPFYRDALAGLRARRGGIDIPVALAVVLIFSASVVNVARGSGPVYFDSVSMFVFVLLLGRHVELRSQVRGRALGASLADALPVTAQRRRADGTLETVAAVELEPGDRVHVAEGGAVSCDGVLESAQARIDESQWTGESHARVHRRGDALAAGCISLDGPLELRITRAVAASALALLERQAASARRARDPADAGTRQAARRFVWRVLALATATAVFWIWRDPTRAFDATVAVLVVACPCAFGLAAPAVLARVLGALAGRGVLVTRAGALGALAAADCALVDKTGTLTEPALDAADMETFRGVARAGALRLAVALARESGHPVARAVATTMCVGEIPLAEAVEAVPGAGVEGLVEGRHVRLGRAAWAGGANDDGDALWLADADGPLARLPMSERVRDEVPVCIEALHASGLECALVSGDAPARVAAVAARLGVDKWWARQSPADKLARVRAQQAAGRVVLAVGDGGNDAAALAAADVSAAVGDAVDLARTHADLLLPGGLAQLPLARETALRAARILAQNRRWSLLWNLGAVPFAAFGLVPPWLAAIGMSVSSLVVVLNTLRIRVDAAEAPSPAPLRTAIA